MNQQGGKFDASEVKAAQADPLLEAKLAVRRWDNQAKVSNMQTPPLSEYEEMAVRSLLRKINSRLKVSVPPSNLLPNSFNIFRPPSWKNIQSSQNANRRGLHRRIRPRIP